MDFFALECECDGVSMSAKRCDESDSVVLGDSSSLHSALSFKLHGLQCCTSSWPKLISVQFSSNQPN